MGGTAERSNPPGEGSPGRHPDVSVVIATYNRRCLLERCLAAVSDQDFEGTYEVIVVDDGGSDGTEAMMACLIPTYPASITYLLRQNGGSAAARNTGIARARGGVIAFLDDDHVATRTWLRDICRCLEDPCVGGVSGRGRAVAGTTLISRYLCFHRAHEAPKVENGEVVHLVAGNSAVRRKVVEEVGPFDERFASFFKGVASGGEDTEFSTRIRKAGYCLAYDPSAITDHHQKTSVKSVLKESFNFGVTRVLWYRMEGRHLSVVAVLRHILWMGFSLIKWPVHVRGYRRQGLGFIESAVFPVIDKVSDLVNHVGTLYGSFRIRKALRAV